MREPQQKLESRDGGNTCNKFSPQTAVCNPTLPICIQPQVTPGSCKDVPFPLPSSAPFTTPEDPVSPSALLMAGRAKRNPTALSVSSASPCCYLPCTSAASQAGIKLSGKLLSSQDRSLWQLHWTALLKIMRHLSCVRSIYFTHSLKKKKKFEQQT